MKLRNFQLYAGLSNDRCPTGYRLSLCAYLVRLLRIYACAHAYLNYVAREYIYIRRGLRVVGLIQWAMRRPHRVERRQSDSTLFILCLILKAKICIVGSSYANKNLSFMSNKKQNEELQSRREFFKKAAKAALPVVGAVVLSSIPFLKAEATTGCTNSCLSSCQGCKGTCTSNCKIYCSGCGTSCFKGCAAGCSWGSGR